MQRTNTTRSIIDKQFGWMTIKLSYGTFKGQLFLKTGEWLSSLLLVTTSKTIVLCVPEFEYDGICYAKCSIETVCHSALSDIVLPLSVIIKLTL